MSETGTDKQSDYQELKNRLSEISECSGKVLELAKEVINFQKYGDPASKTDPSAETLVDAAKAMPSSWLDQLKEYADVMDGNLSEINAILRELT